MNKLIKMHKELVADMFVEVQDLKEKSEKLAALQLKASDLSLIRTNRLFKISQCIQGFVFDVRTALEDFTRRRYSLTCTKAELKRDEIKFERNELKDYLASVQNVKHN